DPEIVHQVDQGSFLTAVALRGIAGERGPQLAVFDPQGVALRPRQAFLRLRRRAGRQTETDDDDQRTDGGAFHGPPPLESQAPALNVARPPVSSGLFVAGAPAEMSR